MTDQGNADEQLGADAEPPEVSRDRQTDPNTVAAAADRAPPPATETREQKLATSPTPVVPTDDVVLLQHVQFGPEEPPRPVLIGGVVIWVSREASEPYVPPAEGTLAFVLGNKHVWQRFMLSMVVMAVAMRIAGVQLHDVITVISTATATALGIAARAYFRQRRRTKQAPTSDTSPKDVSSP